MQPEKLDTPYEINGNVYAYKFHYIYADTPEAAIKLYSAIEQLIKYNPVLGIYLQTMLREECMAEKLFLVAKAAKQVTDFSSASQSAGIWIPELNLPHAIKSYRGPAIIIATSQSLDELIALCGHEAIHHFWFALSGWYALQYESQDTIISPDPSTILEYDPLRDLDRAWKLESQKFKSRSQVITNDPLIEQKLQAFFKILRMPSYHLRDQLSDLLKEKLPYKAMKGKAKYLKLIWRAEIAAHAWACELMSPGFLQAHLPEIYKAIQNILQTIGLDINALSAASLKKRNSVKPTLPLLTHDPKLFQFSTEESDDLPGIEDIEQNKWDVVALKAAVDADLQRLEEKLHYEPGIKLSTHLPYLEQKSFIIAKKEIIIIQHNEGYTLGFAKKTNGQDGYEEVDLNANNPTHQKLLEKLQETQPTFDNCFADRPLMQILQSALLDVIYAEQGYGFEPIEPLEDFYWHAYESLRDLHFLFPDKQQYLQIFYDTVMQLELQYPESAQYFAPGTFAFHLSQLEKNSKVTVKITPRETPAPQTFFKAEDKHKSLSSIIDTISKDAKALPLDDLTKLEKTRADFSKKESLIPKLDRKPRGEIKRQPAITDEPVSERSKKTKTIESIPEKTPDAKAPIVQPQQPTLTADTTLPSIVIPEAKPSPNAPEISKKAETPNPEPAGMIKQVMPVKGNPPPPSTLLPNNSAPSIKGPTPLVNGEFKTACTIESPIKIDGKYHWFKATGTATWVESSEGAILKNFKIQPGSLPRPPIKFIVSFPDLSAPVMSTGTAHVPSDNIFKSSVKIGNYGFVQDNSSNAWIYTQEGPVLKDVKIDHVNVGRPPLSFTITSPEFKALLIKSAGRVLLAWDFYHNMNASYRRDPDLPWHVHAEAAAEITALKTTFIAGIVKAEGTLWVMTPLTALSLAGAAPDMKDNFQNAWKKIKPEDMSRQSLSETASALNSICYGIPFGPGFRLSKEKLATMSLKEINDLNPYLMEGYALQVLGQRLNDLFKLPEHVILGLRKAFAQSPLENFENNWANRKPEDFDQRKISEMEKVNNLLFFGDLRGPTKGLTDKALGEMSLQEFQSLDPDSLLQHANYTIFQWAIKIGFFPVEIAMGVPKALSQSPQDTYKQAWAKIKPVDLEKNPCDGYYGIKKEKIEQLSPGEVLALNPRLVQGEFLYRMFAGIGRGIGRIFWGIKQGDFSISAQALKLSKKYEAKNASVPSSDKVVSQQVGTTIASAPVPANATEAVLQTIKAPKVDAATTESVENKTEEKNQSDAGEQKSKKPQSSMKPFVIPPPKYHSRIPDWLQAVTITGSLGGAWVASVKLTLGWSTLGISAAALAVFEGALSFYQRKEKHKFEKRERNSERVEAQKHEVEKDLQEADAKTDEAIAAMEAYQKEKDPKKRIELWHKAKAAVEKATEVNKNKQNTNLARINREVSMPSGSDHEHQVRHRTQVLCETIRDEQCYEKNATTIQECNNVLDNLAPLDQFYLRYNAHFEGSVDAIKGITDTYQAGVIIEEELIAKVNAYLQESQALHAELIELQKKYHDKEQIKNELSKLEIQVEKDIAQAKTIALRHIAFSTLNKADQALQVDDKANAKKELEKFNKLLQENSDKKLDASFLMYSIYLAFKASEFAIARENALLVLQQQPNNFQAVLLYMEAAGKLQSNAPLGDQDKIKVEILAKARELKANFKAPGELGVILFYEGVFSENIPLLREAFHILKEIGDASSLNFLQQCFRELYGDQRDKKDVLNALADESIRKALEDDIALRQAVIDAHQNRMTILESELKELESKKEIQQQKIKELTEAQQACEDKTEADKLSQTLKEEQVTLAQLNKKQDELNKELATVKTSQENHKKDQENAHKEVDSLSVRARLNRANLLHLSVDLFSDFVEFLMGTKEKDPGKTSLPRQFFEIVGKFVSLYENQLNNEIDEIKKTDKDCIESFFAAYGNSYLGVCIIQSIFVMGAKHQYSLIKFGGEKTKQFANAVEWAKDALGRKISQQFIQVSYSIFSGALDFYATVEASYAFYKKITTKDVLAWGTPVSLVNLLMKAPLFSRFLLAETDPEQLSSTQYYRLFLGCFIQNMNNNRLVHYTSAHGQTIAKIITGAMSKLEYYATALQFLGKQAPTTLNQLFLILCLYNVGVTFFHTVPEKLAQRLLHNFQLRLKQTLNEKDHYSKAVQSLGIQKIIVKNLFHDLRIEIRDVLAEYPALHHLHNQALFFEHQLSGNLEIKSVAKEGGSLFNAIAYYTEENPSELREQALAHVQKNEAVFLPLITGQNGDASLSRESFNAYFVKMQMPSNEGDEFIIRALSEHLHRPIIIFKSGNKLESVTTGLSSEKTSGDAIFVSYVEKTQQYEAVLLHTELYFENMCQGKLQKEQHGLIEKGKQLDKKIKNSQQQLQVTLERIASHPGFFALKPLWSQELSNENNEEKGGFICQ